jgi:hypothetical protein
MKLTIALIAILAFASCKSNSSTALNGNTSGNLNGADYFPLVDNTLFTGHVTGASTDFDINGNITEIDSVDHDYQAVLGLVGSHDGLTMYPLFAFDDNGSETNNGNPVGFGGILDSSVIALDASTPNAQNAATILPKILTVGQTWTPAPLSSTTQCQGKLVEHLAQFTSKGGTPYNDVIHVLATYLDSSGTKLIDERKLSVNADLYFANGIGLVEADINNYEFLQYDGSNSFDFSHGIASGNVWRKS